MNPRELDQLLRQSMSGPRQRAGAADFADSILARLPGMRFVIPGSHPGLRILVLAGALGLLTAIAISLLHLGRRPVPGGPPPSTLFQPAAADTPPPSAAP